LAQRLANEEHALGEICLLDGGVRPDTRHDLLFSDHTVAMDDEKDEEVECLGSKVNRCGPTQQPACGRF
jgi:hypothetical protein